MDRLWPAPCPGFRSVSITKASEHLNSRCSDGDIAPSTPAAPVPPRKQKLWGDPCPGPMAIFCPTEPQLQCHNRSNACRWMPSSNLLGILTAFACVGVGRKVSEPRDFKLNHPRPSARSLLPGVSSKRPQSASLLGPLVSQAARALPWSLGRISRALFCSVTSGKTQSRVQDTGQRLTGPPETRLGFQGGRGKPMHRVPPPPLDPSEEP